MDPRPTQVSFDVDEHHWWFRGRRAVVGAELARLRLPPSARLLDAGCGSGRTLLDLAPLGEVVGIEPDDELARLARSRGDFEVQVGPLEELPWPAETFDLITCLDVIEHAVDDALSLRELLRVARIGGRLLITVPAYPWLWSQHDVHSRHHRRYTRRRLVAALSAAGWDVERVSYFNSVLLPIAAGVRMLQRLRRAEGGQLSGPELGPRWRNRVLEAPLLAEARWMGTGATLPAGLSLLAVAQRV